MTNIQDGGRIIVGVDEDDGGTYRRTGVSADHKATYVVDQMRDQVSRYAAPHVRFTVDIVKDDGGLEFVIISVAPFDEIPVICKADGAGITRSTIYYRNRDARVQSGPISNAHDLRDVLERSAVLLMRRLQGLGLAVQGANARAILDRELGDL